MYLTVSIHFSKNIRYPIPVWLPRIHQHSSQRGKGQTGDQLSYAPLLHATAHFHFIYLIMLQDEPRKANRELFPYPGRSILSPNSNINHFETCDVCRRRKPRCDVGSRPRCSHYERDVKPSSVGKSRRVRQNRQKYLMKYDR